VHVLHRTCKAGLGAAYTAGFAWAREHGYDVVVEMDADGSHSPEQLPRLLAALADADLVLGSRWVPGGEVVNWPATRELLSRGGNAYTRRVLGLPLQDATGGFRAYRRTVLDALPLGRGRLPGLLLPGRPGLAGAPGRLHRRRRCRSPSSSGCAASRR
jgi:dolichol-phosphate mannosyltransferase